MKKIEIAPSLLAADFYSLKDSLKPFNDAQIKYLHFDVMDGNFVENISFGPLVLKSIKNHFDFIMDVHLMINNPLKYYQEFINAGAGIITFHYETLKDDNERLNLIKEVQKQNVLVGISIKPQTDINLLKPLLADIDLVLVMSVEPGFGGQKFLESALDKVKT
ncbi:MAG TPA: ribulose-phosphate 3-epimerase, partial [Candidatus Onthovivens sp.]|nr:ribulose-phosphate 3-epimerase [Candidatus Onthovivens sp.]